LKAKKLLVVSSLVLSLTALFACSNDTSSSAHVDKEVKTKLFQSENEAVAYGKKETPEIQNIIGETNYVDGEKIVIYRVKTKEGEGVGTATLTEKKTKISWSKNGADVILKHKKEFASVKGDFKSASGKKYELYAGVAENPNLKIDTTLENDIQPHIDKESGLYYYIAATPHK